ncbi:MAG TPA: hypothetical protein VM901_11885 [Bdellovibrionota bacterium]|jgi:hypothetical protein|nr:hypothetical protein [Bdellovibrionota bacterium]
MKNLILITLFSVTAVASERSVVIPAPRFRIESPEKSVSLERKSNEWILTSYARKTKAASSQKISEVGEVARVDARYDDIRNWVLESLPLLKPQANCQDIKIRMDGAFSRYVELCSGVPAHLIFATSFYSKISASVN